MKKIAIIEPIGGHGGMNYYDFGLAQGLSSAQHQVVVYTSEETNIPEGLPFQVKKSFCGIWGKAPRFLRAIRFVYCLLKSLGDAKKNNIDIVHFHFFGYTAIELICVRLSRLYCFEIVVTAHDVECFAGNHDATKALKVLSSADKVITHNKVSKQELVAKTLLPASKVYIVSHGNYLESIGALPEKTVARKFLGLSDDEKVILFFGQIKKVKGLDILLHSLPKVINKYPELKLVIAGKVWKDDFSVYEEIIRSYGLADHVISHIHYIPDNEVANYYLSADLVVLPYRKIYQSGVLLMAMSYKVPVLTSNIQGMMEIVVDGENGYIFESEKIDSLSEKLIEIFSDEEALWGVGELGYETVATQYAWDKIGEITSKVYKD